MHDDQKARALRNAEAVFKTSAHYDSGMRDQLAAENASNLEKMAKLKALRLARDAEEKAS